MENPLLKSKVFFRKKIAKLIVNKPNLLVNLKNIKNKLFSMAYNSSLELPGAPLENPDGRINEYLPKFGNLIFEIKKDIKEEIERMNSMEIPSQNDISRLAFKQAVLDYYSGLNADLDDKVMVSRNSNRLVPKFAPDFYEIYDLWIDKLNEYKLRDDKYGLIDDEFYLALDDLQDGMRGSAFEKRLDRYREELVNKILEV